MGKTLVLIFGIAFAMVCNGQQQLDSIDYDYFRSPVDFPIRMAGSFGELRSNHFHAGIDIKTTFAEKGDTLKSVADGYVSRIKVQTGGYGQALYIDHPNGYTSVYAHLKSFSSAVDSFVTAYQTKHKTYEIALYPEKGKFIFSKGDFVGLMGNTGRSYGPHLHFEIRETVSEIPVNPYLFGIGAPDEIPPLLYNVQLLGLDDEINSNWEKVIPASEIGDTTIQIPSWRAGIGVHTFDQMNGASNKNGIYSIEVKLNDSLYFWQVMDKVAFHETRFINCYIDYEQKKETDRTISRCFKTPGNQLSFYRKSINEGVIPLYADNAQKVDITIRDYFGNQVAKTFYLQRSTAKYEADQRIFQQKIVFGQVDTFRSNSTTIVFPTGAIDRSLYFNFQEKPNAEQLKSFQIGEATVPLFESLRFSTQLNLPDTILNKKLCMVWKDQGSLTSFGGTLLPNGIFETSISRLGDYQLMYDTSPPKIISKTFTRNAQDRSTFVFQVEDNLKVRGSANDVKIDVYIDDFWVLSKFKSLGNLLTIPLQKVAAGSHQLLIVAKDDRGNIGRFESVFEK